MLIEFSGINVVRDGFRPEAGPQLHAAARKFFREEALPIDLDDVRRAFRTARNPFETLQARQVPGREEDTDLDTFILLLVGLWNHTSFDALGGRTPAEAITDGERPREGPAALAASLAGFLGAPQGSPASFFLKADIRALAQAEDWVLVPLVCLGGRSPYQVIEKKRIPAPPDGSELPPAAKRLRAFEDDLRLLESPSEVLRECAAIRLSNSGDSRIREPLLRLLDDPSEYVVNMALDTLQVQWPLEARDPVLERIGRWRSSSPSSLVDKAQDLLAAAARPEDLNRLIEGLGEEKAKPSWLEIALPALDDEMRARASAALMRSAAASVHRAVYLWSAVLLLGVRKDVEAITRMCLQSEREVRRKGFPWDDLAEAAGVDSSLFRRLTHSLRPGPACVPWIERNDEAAVPVEPDTAFVAAFCRGLGQRGDEFLQGYRPGLGGQILGEVGGWLVEAAEAATARNPAFARAAAPIAGLGAALAEFRGRPIASSHVTDNLLALCLTLLARAVRARSPREELFLLGTEPSPEALLQLHAAEVIAPEKMLDEPLAQRVDPEALLDTLSSPSLAVAFRAARALVLGHGERYLERIESIFTRGVLDALCFLDWARLHLGDGVLIPTVRLFREFPEMNTAGLLARTCASLSTERSLEVFRRYAEYLFDLADEADLALAVLILGDRQGAEDFLTWIVEHAEKHGTSAAEGLEDYIEAMGSLHGLDDHAFEVSLKLQALREDEGADEEDAVEEEVHSSGRKVLPKPQSPPPVKPLERDKPKIGRNDPCLCGSKKKYKKCCGRAGV